MLGTRSSSESLAGSRCRVAAFPPYWTLWWYKDENISSCPWDSPVFVPWTDELSVAPGRTGMQGECFLPSFLSL